MFKYSLKPDRAEHSMDSGKNKAALRPVPVEDAAIIEQFPLPEQDINSNTIGGEQGNGKKQ